MSYCRWSSDDFQCDVYCYEHVHGGWVTHVAGRRRVFTEPLPPPAPEGDVRAWIERCMKVTKMESEHVDIGLPYDGETFSTDTPGEMADVLERLGSVGYNVPGYAIESLKEESV